MAPRSERQRPGFAAPAKDPWIWAMSCGDFVSAWRLCDVVLAERVRTQTQCCHWPRHEQFLWRGELLAHQRVLVHCYHGLGDTLQFARLLTPLSKIAAAVTAWVQPQLQDILATIEGVGATYPLHDAAPQIERDIDIELMELAHALRVDVATLSDSVPYIDVGRRLKHHSGGPLRVGLVWRSGEWNADRSLDLADVSALLASTREIDWYSFQFGWSRPLPAALKDRSCKNIAAMGRRLGEMDLVISVDTMAAHLAGALALPVWTLLPYECDWRWMLDRSDSPWYPTMRLFRQRRAGDWQSVLEEVSAALRDRIDLRHAG